MGLKEQEKLFFLLCWMLRDAWFPIDIYNHFYKILNAKQCAYYISKWSGLGFYDWGVNEWFGWFVKNKNNMPDRYKELLDGVDKLDVVEAYQNYKTSYNVVNNVPEP